MNKAVTYILLGASLWGTIGWFIKNLYVYGFTPMEVVTLRVTTSAIILLLFLLITSPNKVKLTSLSDIKYFIGTGIFSIIFFNYCMFTAISLSSIPVATALLYTAPAFVAILSVYLFKESFTKRKSVALFVTLIGTLFTVQLIPLNVNNLQLGSILFGIGSGIGYALYSIISKFALNKYSTLSITTFTFVVAAIALIPFFPYQEKLPLLLDKEVLFYAFGLGLFPTAIAYIVYTYGLNQTEASKAAILSTIEPVVAASIGIIIFKETFDMLQMLGMTMIIGAVILMQTENKNNAQVIKLRGRTSGKPS
ncbi:DMT family transporter [Ornithinibacillus bavariensis]|uniref:DMT family transporter n=1 Tax=Ornithinibacillus bavariensis TaxID=545502 RepID=UPI000ED024F5|nr:EamA family transporter [Ornithinibacillus sp.]